jgi:hypothetical protein
MKTRVAKIREREESTQNRRIDTIGQILENDQQSKAILRRSKQDSATPVAAHPTE